MADACTGLCVLGNALCCCEWSASPALLSAIKYSCPVTVACVHRCAVCRVGVATVAATAALTVRFLTSVSSAVLGCDARNVFPALVLLMTGLPPRCCSRAEASCNRAGLPQWTGTSHHEIDSVLSQWARVSHVIVEFHVLYCFPVSC